MSFAIRTSRERRSWYPTALSLAERGVNPEILGEPGVDAGPGLQRRIAEHAVTGGISQTAGDGDLARGLPGASRGDLGRAVGSVRDASLPDPHRTEDGLESEWRGA